MAHVADAIAWPGGYLGICGTCGERNDAITTHADAITWAHDHEAHPYASKVGPRPALKALERLYRQRSESDLYSIMERRQWKILADEIADRDKNDNHELDGQLDLFGEGG